jgi:hypothetical protein
MGEPTAASAEGSMVEETEGALEEETEAASEAAMAVAMVVE